MMALDKFDARVDALVVETKTLWDANCGKLSDEDRTWLSRAIHQSPQLATHVLYERAHTGFTRVVTMTVEDIQQLYQHRVTQA